MHRCAGASAAAARRTAGSARRCEERVFRGLVPAVTWSIRANLVLPVTVERQCPVQERRVLMHRCYKMFDITGTHRHTHTQVGSHCERQLVGKALAYTTHAVSGVCSCTQQQTGLTLCWQLKFQGSILVCALVPLSRLGQSWLECRTSGIVVFSPG